MCQLQNKFKESSRNFKGKFELLIIVKNETVKLTLALSTALLAYVTQPLSIETSLLFNFLWVI